MESDPDGSQPDAMRDAHFDPVSTVNNVRPGKANIHRMMIFPVG